MHVCEELHVLWISCKINQCIWTAENFPLCADPIIGQDLGNLLSACDFLGGDEREFSVKNRKWRKSFWGSLCVAEFPEDTKVTMVEKSPAVVMISWN